MPRKLEQTAERRKKLLEKIEYFAYQLELNGARYHHVLYLRFNKPSGILIVDQDGQAVSRELARQVVAPINYYNNIAKGAGTDLVREKDRDVKPMVDLHRILTQQEDVFIDTPVAQDCQRVVQMLDLILDGQQTLRQIFEDLKAIDIEARDKRGYITMRDVDQFVALNEQYQSILYRQGKAQKETYASMDALARFIKERKSLVREHKRAIDVLVSFQHASVKKTLDESLQSFEQDKQGKRHQFADGEAGVAQMLALYKEKTQYETEHELFKLLRNG
ncbi:hypothetical protein BEP19_08850 [Ammoniphilus oxalaticus]|uniref:Uncharacterized protein n=1 Tax=Ammoniphilus oxalaticus TaxID=66863 RepID=A0A419SKE3_9BACL|nr:hypothetical protein [Ammoniphilus oxalaticus]RKD24483.1 hypothetical protein BEP19_08850 [Ammoniphilus oxalaticus]